MTCCGDEGASPEDQQGSQYTKRTFEPHFKGPIDKRSCTDIICCLLFLACLAGLAVVAYFAFSMGDPQILLKPTDSKGNICSLGLRKGRPYLQYFDLLACATGGATVLIRGCPTPQICVESCPNTSWVWLTLFAEEKVAGGMLADQRRAQLRCIEGVNILDSTKSIEYFIKQKLCAPYYLNSTALVDRCIPTIFYQTVDLAQVIVSQAGDFISNADNTTVTYQVIQEASKVLAMFLSATNVAQNVIQDVVSAWWMILIGIGIGAILSFVWCLLMRCFAGLIVYLTLALFFIGFIGASAYCFYNYAFVATESAQGGNFHFSTNVNYYLALRETWLGLGIVGASLALIILLLVICLRKRIALAIAILGQASKAVAAITTSLFYPIIPWIFELGVIGLWGAVTVYLAATGRAMLAPSSGNATAENVTQCQSFSPGDLANPEALGCQFVQYGGNEWSYYLQAYNLFMAFWLLCFTVGMGQIVLAGAFASWYWSWEKPKDIPAFPIAASLWRTIRYHIGTVAFGSLLVAIVMLIRVALELLQRKLKDSKNAAAKCCICMLRCCFWCLEKCLKFLTKNAFIVTAIYGKAFCPAAKDAFFLILRNCVRLVVLDNVTGFVIFVGKLLMTGAAGVAAFFFFDGSIPYVSQYRPSLSYFFVPVIVIIIGTFVVATLFFSVYSFAVDTLFICVMEDLERNDGSPEKPYFMSKDLMKVLDKENKFEDNAESRDACCCCCF